MAFVLLIDDDPRHLELIGALLEPLHVRIATVPSAEAASDAIARERPDLVITDVNLPRMSGLELVRRLKADATTRVIPVLVISGHAVPEDELVARAAGCDGYLVKPASAVRLRTEVERLLRSR